MLRTVQPFAKEDFAASDISHNGVKYLRAKEKFANEEKQQIIAPAKLNVRLFCTKLSLCVCECVAEATFTKN